MWSVHAAARFETQGIPSVMIATDLFLEYARRLLASLGCGHVPVLITPDPIVYLDHTDIQRRADVIVPQIKFSLASEGQTSEPS